MNIEFQPFAEKHLPLWLQWIEKPHVKAVWFIEGYESADYIHAKIKGNGYDYPFAIYWDNKSIGYIVCCDLYAYRTQCLQPKGLFINENPGTFCMDLFIAEEKYLDQGYGTRIVQKFVDYIFEHFNAKTILIDPAITNTRAIRCYEKAGFSFLKKAHDGITECYVMNIGRTPQVTIRQATLKDLEAMVDLLADDTLGKSREENTRPLLQTYIDAFHAIQANSRTELLVVDTHGTIIGMAQLDFITCLTYQGGTRAQIESVRIHRDYRNAGVGKLLLQALIERAKQKKCHMIQLTTNKLRPRALHFYEALGFAASHEGLKLIFE